ncbi:MAG TPA: hypothetical protein VEQ63_12510, partial [Bryobacteraceae bacterium]|nr:hypothetical protein [Bryobacteraceae bacterium]
RVTPQERVFLLSPANSSGKRASMVTSSRAQFALAVRLRKQGAALGDVFSFVSGLYFRGKIAYSQAFEAPPPDCDGSYIITTDRGLVPPSLTVTTDCLLQMSAVPIDSSDEKYRSPLIRDARRIAECTQAPVVLLGSIATSKYVEPLLEVFGERLLFPLEFVGRGDMSRGGLMLRSARSGEELEYIPVANAIRKGQRPAKLPKLIR